MRKISQEVVGYKKNSSELCEEFLNYLDIINFSVVI